MKRLYLLILLTVTMYFVVGGVSNIIINEKFEAAMDLPESPTSDTRNNNFRNIEEQDASEEYEKLQSFFPVYSFFGSTLSYLFTLISFGALGGIIRILLSSLTSNVPIEEQKILTIPILGGLIGLLTIVIAELMPEFKYQSGNDKVYYSLALLGGIFTEEFFKWLHRKLKEAMNPEEKQIRTH